jgi:ribosomal protein S14
LVGVSTKPSSSKRLPSRCEKAGHADDVLRTFALKPYGKQGERDERER